MSPLGTDIEKLLLRDLAKLEEEINLYPSEAAIWLKSEGIANPAGNLCLHLCGNLRHYLGTVLGHTSYQRNRQFEFECPFLPRPALIAEISETRFTAAGMLPRLTEADLDREFPVQVFQTPMTTRFFLIHLTSHFNYHLGQINYHRRLVAQGKG